jgi:hypothetical protein
MRYIHRLLPVLAASALLSGPAAAQPQACAAEAFRAFDYWIGEWTVTDTAGTVVGSNTITSVSNGCGILEQWTSAAGGTGVSINFHDPRTGKWTQRWVGAGGSFLLLEGGPVDGTMELKGERPGPGGATVLDRIRWIPLAPGRVRQLWESSTDAGATWTTQFNGLYVRSLP